MPEHALSSQVGKRYQILDKLGEGGMGAVYRTTDRLTGQTVALKRVTAPSAQLQFASRATMGDSADFRRALAQEFRTLASLRHPNIISVLDYGFDEQRQPYFTMDLLEGSQSIIEAGRKQPVAKQLELLIQMLQALAYLHRRGILHRDLKPDNVHVVNGQVKVLDFGLAVTRTYDQEDGHMAGTLAYMAPEVLGGTPFSEAADLYGVGVMAYELLVGHHPFPAGRLYDILYTAPDLSGAGLDELLAAVISRLLAKTPTERYSDATELIQIYANATGQQAKYETAAIRESYLQAAQFVGREVELNQLSEALSQITASNENQGSAWLVGGESGVGKSRLLDELRTQALVTGVLVLRGQAIAEGGAPYHLWREALRYLCLQTELSDFEASVLKTLVPDISHLLGRAISDAPETNPQGAQIRLLTTIEDVLRRQTQPIVLLLEDLQWSSESLTVLRRMSSVVGQLPLVIVGTYRDDERPDLPGDLPEMKAIKLPRLGAAAIADLSAAMLGENGRQPQVIDLLQRETEGNIFFIVEVVRALAEEAGELDRIGATVLPQKIFAGGIQAVVQRRLSRIPGSARPLLQTACIAGRELNLEMLQAIAPGTSLDSWLTACADASVLEVQDGRWRFAHDKLREGLLSEIAEDQGRALHRQVAEVMEAVFVDRLSEFHSIIGEHFLYSQGWEQAADHLIKAGDAAARLNASSESRLQYARAMEALSHVPENEGNRRRRAETIIKQVSVSYMADDPAQNLKRLAEAEALLKELPGPDGKPGSDRLNLARVHYWMGRAHSIRNEMRDPIGYYRQVLSVAQELGDEDLLAIPAAMIGRAVFFQGQFGQAASFLSQAVAPLEKSGNWTDWILTVGYLGCSLAAQGHYAAGLAHAQRGLARSLEIKSPIGITFSTILLSTIYVEGGELAKAVEATRSGAAMAEQSGEHVYVYVGNGMQAWSEGRLGQYEAATSSMARCKAVAQGLGGQLLLIHWFAAFEAEILLGAGRSEEALFLAEKTVTNSRSVAELFSEGLAHRVWGQALAASNPPHWDEAETHLAASLHALEAGEARLEAARTHVAWGAFCRDRGAFLAAREHFEKAAAQFEVSELQWEFDKVKALIGQLPRAGDMYQSETSQSDRAAKAFWQ